MDKNFILKTDILDIIFEKRNKAYGAYDLRKFYPNRLKLALGFMFIIASAFSAFTLLPKKERPVFKKDNLPETVMTKVHEIPREPEKKIDIVKPVAKTVVTPVAQKVFTSKPVIVPNDVKTEPVTTLLPTDVIGTKNITTPGTEPILVEPVKTEPGTGGPVNVTPKIDNTIPRDINVVDVPPSYPGGMDALIKFLEKNLHTPDELESGETVNVRVKFVVDYTGKLQSFVTVLDGGDAYNKEVVRVLKKMPNWIPGKANGENVPVYFTIPVKFVMAD